MANFLNLFTAYRNMENQDRADATNNYLNKTQGAPTGVDAGAVQTFRSNQNTMDAAQQTQHLQNMSAWLGILGNADAQAQNAVGPAPVAPGDNATPEQVQQYQAASHTYENTLSQAQQQARGQAWEQASRIAPSLGIDPQHMAPMQQDFMQHGTRFAQDVHSAIQERLVPNSGEVVGTPGGTQDANGNVVLVTRGGQQHTLTGVAPTSSVDTNTRVAATRDVAASNDTVQREAIQERRDASAAAHPAQGGDAVAQARETQRMIVGSALDSANQALQNIGSSHLMASGPMSSAARWAASHTGGTVEYDLQQNLESVKDALSVQDMRSFSESTGGRSIGARSTAVFSAVSRAVANLDIRQNPDQLKRNLGLAMTVLNWIHRNPTATPAAAPAAADTGNAPPAAPASGNTLSPEAQALLNGFD